MDQHHEERDEHRQAESEFLLVCDHFFTPFPSRTGMFLRNVPMTQTEKIVMTMKKA